MIRSCVVAVVAFVAVVVTLSWHDFRDGMENFVVATSAETLRDGHWLVPHLHGRPRLEKPPLAHWVTSVGMEAAGAMGVGSVELSARWASLLLAVTAIPGVYVLGRIVFADRRAALAAAVVLASSYFFLKYGRRASYDAMLLSFATWTLVGLAWAVFGRAPRRGLLLAGIMAALGFMTKGPPVLVVTVVPTLLFLLARRWLPSPAETPLPHRQVSPDWRAWLLGAGAFALLASPWYVLLWSTVPSALEVQSGQVTLRNERLLEQINRGWSNLPAAVVMCGVWTPMLVLAFVHMVRTRHAGAMWAGLLTVLPPLLMIAVAPLRERYLMPIVVPGSLLAGWFIANVTASEASSRLADWLCRGQTWLAGGLVVAAGVMSAIAPGSLPWAVLAAAGGLALCVGVVAWWLPRSILLPGGLVLVLMAQALYYHADQFTAGGRSSAKAFAGGFLPRFPDAVFVSAGSQPSWPLELPVYLDRTIYAGVAAPAGGGPRITIVQDGSKDPLPESATAVGRLEHNRRSWTFYLDSR
jgi:4-amino-4-deoxy-L-arabinose transferase-like glycosyltransferase